jgi:hypothetical protein
MTEHFVTLFDRVFLPQGMALWRSLERHAGDHVLWVVCMDAAVHDDLKRLRLPNVRLIPLAEIEGEEPRLLQVKGDRERGEYCWTLTPFVPEAVMRRAPEATRVTYLDSDVFFFGTPSMILEDMDLSGADALITEHGYDPRYRKYEELSGRFCVQFMPFRRTEQGLAILHWWQDRCIEWCHARFEDGKFGDQKYLDDWPTRFGASVRVHGDVSLTLAPWNLGRLLGEGSSPECMVHFQNLRIMDGGLVRLWAEYALPHHVRKSVYDPYVRCLREGARLRREVGISLKLPAPPRGLVEWLRRSVRSRRRTESWIRIGRI